MSSHNVFHGEIKKTICLDIGYSELCDSDEMLQCIFS